MKRMTLILAALLLFSVFGTASAGGKCYDHPELCAPMEIAAQAGIAKASELKLRPTGSYWYENEANDMSSIFVYLDKPLKKVTPKQANHVRKAMVQSLRDSGVMIAWYKPRSNSHIPNAIGVIFCVTGGECE